MELKPTKRFDALDRERFEEMIASPPFAIFRQRIQAALAVNERACQDQADIIELRRAQGAAKALHMVLRLPEQIVEEMKEKRP